MKMTQRNHKTAGFTVEIAKCIKLNKRTAYLNSKIPELNNRTACLNNKTPELNNRPACLNSKIPELNNRTACLNSKILSINFGGNHTFCYKCRACAVMLCVTILTHQSHMQSPQALCPAVGHQERVWSGNRNFITADFRGKTMQAVSGQPIKNK